VDQVAAQEIESKGVAGDCRSRHVLDAERGLRSVWRPQRGKGERRHGGYLVPHCESSFARALILFSKSTTSSARITGSFYFYDYSPRAYHAAHFIGMSPMSYTL
jgi:hypothetical protein